MTTQIGFDRVKNSNKKKFIKISDVEARNFLNIIDAASDSAQKFALEHWFIVVHDSVYEFMQRQENVINAEGKFIEIELLNGSKINMHGETNYLNSIEEPLSGMKLPLAKDEAFVVGQINEQPLQTISGWRIGKDKKSMKRMF